MSLREVPTVDDGITERSVSPDGSVIVVVYQPGNGTRYTVVFTDLRNLSNPFLGVGQWLVNVLGVGAMQSYSNGYLAYDYVQEKLRCGVADAVVLAELIGRELGRKYVTCEEYKLKNADVA